MPNPGAASAGAGKEERKVESINKVQSFPFSPALNPGEAWCNAPRGPGSLGFPLNKEAWVDHPGNPAAVHGAALLDGGFQWQTAALQS